MPIPFLIGAAVIAASGAGIKKGFDANDKNKKAKKIVEDAQQRFKEAEEKLKEEGEILNENLKDFAEFKLTVFTTQIKYLVELVKQCKNRASSHLIHEKITFTPEELRQLENSVSTSLEITTGIAKGVGSGAVIALGAYGSVGLLASASTGTAISTLSGAAATNATLAWLGGGSLAAGGGGMALGTAVLGGIVAGPLIAVAGFMMDSKAEENLTSAYDYEKEVDINIEKMKLSIEGFKTIDRRINELRSIIDELIIRFNNICMQNIAYNTRSDQICKSSELDKLIILGKNLKIALDIPLLDKEGNENKNFNKEIQRIKIS